MKSQTIRQLCIDNNWFTCGSNEQYSKLFEVAEDGATIDQIARIIWLCSDGVSEQSIIKALYAADDLSVDKVRDRYENLKSMHEIMKSINDENAYMSWINWVPDEPGSDDFWSICYDSELFKDCVNAFQRIYRKYGESGLFIGGKLY